MAEQGQEGRAESEGELFRLLVENVVDYAIFVVDTDGLVRTWSHGAERLLGYTEDEILGRTADVFFTPEDVRDDIPRTEMRQALDTGRGDDDRWHVRKDGTRFWVSGVMTPLRDEGGGLRGFAKIMRDRTEWWHAEQARLEGEGRFRTAFAHASVGMAVTDAEGRFLDANPAYCEITGYALEELLPKDLATVTHPDDLPKNLGLIRRMLDGGDPGFVIEKRYVRKDGGIVWVKNSVSLVRDGEGRPLRMIALVEDITQRKGAEDALQAAHRELEARVAERTSELSKANEFLRALLESIQDGIVACDGEGVLTLFNRATQEFHGLPPEPLPADRWAEHYDLYRADGQTRLPKEEVPLFRALRGERVRGVEMVIAPKDGPVRTLLSSGQAFRDDRGRTLGAVVSMHDITARKEAEAALRTAYDELEVRVAERTVELRAAKDDAERANMAKDQFLAVLSHELRTPLNPILLAVSSMLDRPTPPEDVRPTLEMVRQNVNLQARLIDDLLDVMRIIQGKMPLHWGISDCHALVQRAVEICRSEVHGKGHRLVLDLSAGEHWVNADSARLQQVLWNLVKNAVKFTPEGGTITIRTRNEGDRDERIVIEVADTGIGIEPEVIPTIWDPFQQGETTITRRFGGLGLGLAICKGVVDAHGGTLTAESPGHGKGTTFRVVLGTIPAPADSDCDTTDGKTLSTSPTPSLIRLNILLVEDEAATLRLMSRLLIGLGHRVTTAGTVADAWGKFQGGDFDLIISDIGLPDGTGLDLMRKVKALRRVVPAIALTGYGMDEDIRRSRDAGFTTHMTKPIDFTKLEAMIRQVAN